MPYHDEKKDWINYWRGVPGYLTSNYRLSSDMINRAIEACKNYNSDTDGDEKMKDCCGVTFKYSSPDDSLIKTAYDLSYKRRFTPVQIIFNDPATIVFWEDGTKTVVKCAPGTPFNKYAGFCAALAKHVYVSNSAINRLVNDGLDQNPPKPEKTAAKATKNAEKETINRLAKAKGAKK